MEKSCLCALCKAVLVPDEDDIVEFQCGYIASKEVALTNTSITVTILDDNKIKVNLRLDIDQIDACYNPDNKLTKKEKERKIIKTKVNVTYDKESMQVASLKLAQ